MTKLLIQQARLETGFEYINDRVHATKTDLYDVLIEEGKIIEVEKNLQTEADKVINAESKLLMPSFREMHIHVDKTYFSGPWKACIPITKGILTRIEEEETLLPQQLPVAKQRAEKMIEWLISKGHTHIRSHCNVDPKIGTKHIEITQEAFSKFDKQVTYDIVAFPQHGLLRSKVEPLMREAMRMGATLVGGVDPATIDRNIDKSLNTMMDIAVESNSGLDIHIHDPNSLGAFQFYKLADLTKKANKVGKVTISHAMALSDLHGKELDDMITSLVEARIDVTTTVPINRPTIPIPYLYENGVPVSLGHDSLTDHWSPFGTGNTIEKLCVLSERFRFIDEYSLNRSWKYATGGITPLNDMGEQVWPKKGDSANMILIDADCSAQAVARRLPITHVLFEGNVVYSKQERRVK
ncbi:amidohydrolase family protein [Lederbergia wuyishanensis]|uniref:Cytosine/adenosine deaminase-related metal-dependent hydrolase n=1 Tax=Lederbergia wuyishanensis TaxID=1347903 RepID=A0ABU0D854_9BACI|nr:amidohydrolase family protein [Lederbergia wuyishanensis]MCJ8009264.1 amidohydrolase family protein [Lederbergia wuyishanensis]MDQ0344603.1 cytosine/adenosine deaminase-related metal-dependent hydrolase [Lederbergia wuyishanensis]